MLMSFEEILDRWVISASVLVRSTNESRPSSADRRMIDRFGGVVSLVDEVGADSIDGTWGARRDNPVCWEPK